MVGAGHSRYQPLKSILGQGEIVNVESGRLGQKSPQSCSQLAARRWVHDVPCATLNKGLCTTIEKGQREAKNACATEGALIE